MSGNIFMLEEGEWVSLGFVDDGGLQLSSDESDDEWASYVDVIRDITEMSFTFDIECCDGSLRRFIEALYVVDKLEVRRMRSEFARRRRIGGTGRHRGGRL